MSRKSDARWRCSENHTIDASTVGVVQLTHAFSTQFQRFTQQTATVKEKHLSPIFASERKFAPEETNSVKFCFEAFLKACFFHIFRRSLTTDFIVLVLRFPRRYRLPRNSVAFSQRRRFFANSDAGCKGSREKNKFVFNVLN